MANYSGKITAELDGAIIQEGTTAVTAYSCGFCNASRVVTLGLYNTLPLDITTF